MSRFLRRFALIAIAALGFWTGPSAARGDLITSLTVDVTQTGGGPYTYSYSLSVDPNSTLGAAQFFLEVSPTANLGAVSAPSGWAEIYSAGDPDIFFLSLDPSTDVAPGMSGSFSFTSTIGPSPGDDLVRGFGDDGSVGENSGMILTPASVPEPSSLLLGVLGVAGAAVWCRTRRWSKA